MKMIVFSDSHGDTTVMRSALKKHNRRTDVVAFCGDGWRDLAEIRNEFPDKAYFSVRGNCDWYCNEPLFQEFELAGKKIFMTHGHMFDVKMGSSHIVNYGRSNGYDILLFGHTHKQLTSVEGSMLLLNPGSVGHGGNYSIIEINEQTGKIKATEYPYNDFGPVIL